MVNSQKNEKDADELQKARAPTNRDQETKGENVELGVYKEKPSKTYAVPLRDTIYQAS